MIVGYVSRRDYRTLDGLQRQQDDFELNDPDNLKWLMRLSDVSIEEASGDGASVIVYFNSILDEEHGVEVVTNQAEIEGDYPDVFPFELPQGLHATDIAPEPAGHRLVEFKQNGKWCGIYVLVEGLRVTDIL